MDTASVPQVAKKEYRNNTAGWLGVVTLDHTGREQGVSIEPGGTIWLSDAEAILTARAPRRAEDNPFLERAYVVMDPQTGTRREVKLRPLTLVSDRTKDMYASDRYVPGLVSDEEARAGVERAARDGADGPRTQATAQREAEVLGGPPITHAPAPPTQLAPAPPSTGAPPPPDVAAPAVHAPTPVPPIGGLQGAPGAADTVAEEPRSWVEPPEAPGRVLRGALAGDDTAPADMGDPTLPQPGDRVQRPVQGVPETVGARLGAEEHAERVDPRVGEETGAARPPSQPQVEGEYARAEEVGSPRAPQAEPSDTEGLLGA